MPMLRPFMFTLRQRSAHLSEIVAGFRRRADDLFGQHRGADAAPAGGIEAVLDRDIVVDQDALHLDAIGVRPARPPSRSS